MRALFWLPLSSTTWRRHPDSVPHAGVQLWPCFFQLDDTAPPSRLRIVQNNNTNNEITFLKPTITLKSSLIMNFAWQPLLRESPLKLMFKELYIKSSNSWEGSSYKVETSVAIHAFFNGEIREEKKVYKIILVLLYYLNTMTAYDIHSAQRERKQKWRQSVIQFYLLEPKI